MEPWDALIRKLVKMKTADNTDREVGRKSRKLRNSKGQNSPRGLECAKRCLAGTRRREWTVHKNPQNRACSMTLLMEDFWEKLGWKSDWDGFRTERQKGKKRQQGNRILLWRMMEKSGSGWGAAAGGDWAEGQCFKCLLADGIDALRGGMEMLRQKKR